MPPRKVPGGTPLLPGRPAASYCKRRSADGPQDLIIEDDAETAAYLSRGLSQEGHSVEQAANGQDGLFQATDGSFDLIILDRMLPVLDGLSVLKALRAAKIETPVSSFPRSARSATASRDWNAAPTIIS